MRQTNQRRRCMPECCPQAGRVIKHDSVSPPLRLTCGYRDLPARNLGQNLLGVVIIQFPTPHLTYIACYIYNEGVSKLPEWKGFKMETNKKFPTPLDAFPNGRVKKKVVIPEINTARFKGEIDLKGFKEVLANRKTLITNLDLARRFFGDGGITGCVTCNGHITGIYLHTDEGYELIMEWGPFNNDSGLILRGDPKFFETFEAVNEYCAKAYYKNPYRSVERYNVHRHW